MTVLVHDAAYAGWVFSENHPTQGRRFINAAQLISAQLGVRVLSPRSATRAELERVHTPEYVSEVMDTHVCGEWAGQRPDMSALAALFVGGTLTALDELFAQRTQVAVNLPGGKHHAHADHASGFCVFADLAIAASIATEQGHRVAILDIDAHHGDGTEALCSSMPNVLTFSVHQHGIFPGTGLADAPEVHAYNEPLPAQSGDVHLLGAVARFVEVSAAFAPSVMFIAAGADGHADDPLSALRYTEAGFHQAGAALRRAFPSTPMLVTGAGGYRPDDATPASWAHFVAGVSGLARE
ncbi:MAG: histone deacetylase family protein [Actinobacteria bacterium]|nr:histone deacetylase family protein [Actinomycetota bacterium]